MRNILNLCTSAYASHRRLLDLCRSFGFSEFSHRHSEPGAENVFQVIYVLERAFFRDGRNRAAGFGQAFAHLFEPSLANGLGDRR